MVRLAQVEAKCWRQDKAVALRLEVRLALQASSGIVSLGAAPIADRTGRKPAIYVAVTIMAFVYVGYCFVDTYEWVIVLGITYGAGNGVYIAVDYALAVDCLPSQVAPHPRCLLRLPRRAC